MRSTYHESTNPKNCFPRPKPTPNHCTSRQFTLPAPPSRPQAIIPNPHPFTPNTLQFLFNPDTKHPSGLSSTRSPKTQNTPQASRPLPQHSQFFQNRAKTSHLSPTSSPPGGQATSPNTHRFFKTSQKSHPIPPRLHPQEHFAPTYIMKPNTPQASSAPPHPRKPIPPNPQTATPAPNSPPPTPLTLQTRTNTGPAPTSETGTNPLFTPPHTPFVPAFPLAFPSRTSRELLVLPLQFPYTSPSKPCKIYT